jgi:phosphoribosylpyrophosphate synthetase
VVRHRIPAASGVVHVWRVGRQDGSAIKEVGAKYSIPTHDFVVLAADQNDVQMAKNGAAVLVAAAWAADSRTNGYGISVASPAELVEVLGLVDSWPGDWYFAGDERWYRLVSLSNVSGKRVGPAQEAFAAKVVRTIKGGGPRLQALLVVTARSLLMGGIAGRDDLMWGFYPSAGSDNADGETLSDFAHRLRTVASRVKFAERGVPLFTRHTPSVKRSGGWGSDRTDPAGQIGTIHINPAYRGKVRGRNVVVLDDCATYGVSFGVSAALLRAAGAASVTCVALGKFGDCLDYYEIDVASDPFAPLLPATTTSGCRAASQARGIPQRRMRSST